MKKTWASILVSLVALNFVFAQDAASTLKSAFYVTEHPLKKDICDLLTINENPVTRPTFMKMPVEPPCFSNPFAMMFFAQPQPASRPDFFMEPPQIIDPPVAKTRPEPLENPDNAGHDFRITSRPPKQNQPEAPAIVLSSPNLDTNEIQLRWAKYQQDLENYQHYEKNCQEYEKYHHYQEQKKKYEEYKTQAAEYQHYCAQMEQYNLYLDNLTQYLNNEDAINKYLSYQIKEKYYTEIEEAKKASDAKKLQSIYDKITSLFYAYENNKRVYQTYLEKKRSYERYLNLLQKGVKINDRYYRIQDFSCEEVCGFIRDKNWIPHPTWDNRSPQQFLRMANHHYINFSMNPDGSILATWTRLSYDFEYREGEARASFKLVSNPD